MPDKYHQKCEQVKAMLASSLTNAYPDVVKACIDNDVSLEAFRAIEAALIKQTRDDDPYSLLVD